MTTTTKTFLAQLLTVKGIGPKAIEKLNKAELTSSKAIENVGRQGLAAIGFNESAISLILNNLPKTKAVVETPPVEEKTWLPQQRQAPTVMELALSGAGIDRASLPQGKPSNAPTPAKKKAEPKAKKTDEPVILTVDVSGQVADGETTMRITNPLQLRYFADQLDFSFPKNVKGINGLVFVDAAGKPVEFKTAWVIQVVLESGKSRLSIVSNKSLDTAFAAIKATFEPQGATVKKMWLSAAIEKLFAGYRKQLTEKKAAAAQRVREDELDRVVSEIVNLVGNDPRGEKWLTPNEVEAVANPLDLFRLSGMIESDFRKELGFDIDEDTAAEFTTRLSAFMSEYDRRLMERARDINNFADHAHLVKGVQGWAAQQKSYPDLKLVMLKFRFKSIDDYRYLVIHEDMVDAFRAAFQEKYGIRLGGFPLLLEWIGVRGQLLVSNAVEALEAKDAAEFKASSDGKALMAAFAGDPDDVVLEDAELLL